MQKLDTMDEHINRMKSEVRQGVKTGFAMGFIFGLIFVGVLVQLDAHLVR